MKNQRYIIKGLVGLFLLFCFVSLHAKDNSVLNTIIASDTTTAKLIDVKGYVRDAATKTPLLGAKVQSKDFLFSAITNEDGYFTISIPKHVKVLDISASDYTLIEYPIQGKTSIDVSLISELPAISEPSALTADAQIHSLRSADVRVITRSGAPAIGSSMFIRGYNSLNANAQPLIIVDGVIFDNQYDRLSIHQGFALNPLSNINLDDVESIEVIKDGTSLYGSKGGNGVLVITTKRGKDAVTRITVSSMVGYNERPKTIPMMNSDQFRVYVSDVLKGSTAASYISTLPFLNDNTSYYDYARYHNDNNWSDNTYQNGMTQAYSVNVNGGDNIALYQLSVGYTDSKSTLKSNDFSRFNTRFNADIDLSKKFKISFDLLYSQTDRNLRDDGFNESADAIITSPAALALIKSPFLIPYERSNAGVVLSDLSESDFLGIANPLSIINTGVGKSSQNYLSLTLKPKYNITRDLKLSGILNYSLSSLFEKYFRPDKGVAEEYLFNDVDAIAKSYVKGQNSNQISLSTNIFLNWIKQFNIHAFDVTGGFRFNTDSYRGEFGSGYNTPTDLNPNLSKDLKYRYTTGYDDSWKSLSWYANGEYTLSDKYIISGVVSADASSRFGKDADMLKIGGVHWGIYPSLNASWLVSSENFMKSIPAINRLKLRLGYGLTGNDNIPTGSTVTSFSPILYINKYTGKTLSNIGNTTLKPETVEKSNLGADLTMFNNRISVSADVYHHITYDLLALKQFKAISGMDSYWTNGGKMQNDGFEISFNAKAIVVKNFQWELGGSLAHYKNRILELPETENLNKIYGAEVKTMVGQPAGVFYGYKTLGVFATTKEAVDANLKITNLTGTGYVPFAAGDIRFADLHEDHIINENDKTIIGDPNPDFTGSFNTRIAYKRLSLTALFTFSSGNDIYNYVRSQIESGSNLYNQSLALQNRWVSEGQQTSVPKSSFGDYMGNNRFSDRWIEDGSYLRFKTLTLSYDVPVKSVFISGFTVWVSANNLLTFTKYLGVDPEFSINNSVLYQGIDAGLLSQGRSCFVGLKLNL